jgi:hypothetical protein
VIAGLGVDELDVDPHAVAAALRRAFKHIAHVKFAANLLHVVGLTLVGESGVARDHERAGDARKIGGETLGDAIDEIVLFRIAAYIGKGEDHDREVRCFGWDRNQRQSSSGLPGHRPADFERIGPDRLGDVLELGQAQIADGEIETGPHLAISVFGQADGAGLSNTFEARCDIDAITHQVAVAFYHYIAKMDSNAKLDAAFRRKASVALNHAVLYFDCAAHSVNNTTKLNETSIAGALYDTPIVHGDDRID